MPTPGDGVSQLRLNPLLARWVTVSLDRANRPAAFAPRMLAVEDEPRACPFCPGNEDETPATLEAHSGPDGEWSVRVVPNRYPAFSGTEPLAVTNLGPVFTQAPASGSHEVVIFTPDHESSWADFDERQIGLVMEALRERVEAHAAMPNVRYTQVIVNHGREAGASMAHPHGQVLGVPFVPKELADEEHGFARFKGSCVLCTTLEAELEAGYRTIAIDDLAVAVCPFWSGTPYEALVIPRAHEAHLNLAKPDDATAVGRVLKEVLARLRSVHGDVAYNLVIHTAPHRHDVEFHWHAHVLPKLTTRAGFELGTGVLINIVPPEQAAAELRAVTPSS